MLYKLSALFAIGAAMLGISSLMLMRYTQKSVVTEIPATALPQPFVAFRATLTPTAQNLAAPLPVDPAQPNQPVPTLTRTPMQVVELAPTATAVPFKLPIQLEAAAPVLQIPHMGLAANIVDVPLHHGTWDTASLDYYIGQLHLPETDQAYAPIYAAHTSLTKGVPGPFYNLSQLPIGSELSLTVNGTTATYILQNAQVVPANQIEAMLIPDPTALVLVTCSGWDTNTEIFQDRIVAHAVLKTNAS